MSVSEQRQLTIVMFSLQAEQSKLLWSLEVSEWNTRQLIRVMLGLQAENSKLFSYSRSLSRKWNELQLYVRFTSRHARANDHSCISSPFTKVKSYI